jgi:hypothetical protein
MFADTRLTEANPKGQSPDAAIAAGVEREPTPQTLNGGFNDKLGRLARFLHVGVSG